MYNLFNTGVTIKSDLSVELDFITAVNWIYFISKVVKFLDECKKNKNRPILSVCNSETIHWKINFFKVCNLNNKLRHLKIIVLRKNKWHTNVCKYREISFIHNIQYI